MKQALTDRQKKFLAECETSPQSLRTLLDEQQIPSDELGRWLNDAAFTRGVGRLRKRLQFIREMELIRGAAHGARRLNETAHNNEPIKSLNELRACVQLCRLARFVVRRRQRQQNAPTSGPAYHASLSREDAEKLLADLTAHA